MKFSEVELPSNKKFGIFFTLVFVLVTTYFYVNSSLTWVYVFAAVTGLFLTVTIVKADALLPLNKLWMMLGFVLGIIISPIVLGIIFYGIFTPIAILMRLFKRDELRLKFKNKTNHWVLRSESIQNSSFKNQF